MNYLLKYILFERNKNDNILYHGSLKKYDILKPFKSSLINDEQLFLLLIKNGLRYVL
jgi:hypothetical protein